MKGQVNKFLNCKKILDTKPALEKARIKTLPLKEEA
jgi:hypothetical protein